MVPFAGAASVVVAVVAAWRPPGSQVHCTTESVPLVVAAVVAGRPVVGRIEPRVQQERDEEAFALLAGFRQNCSMVLEKNNRSVLSAIGQLSRLTSRLRRS